MKPAAIIASTYDRQRITAQNITLLEAQGIKVMSWSNEDFTSLGAKWQFLVNIVRPFALSHLIITGSDDILHKDFLNRIDSAYAFNGLQQWYIYEPIRRMLYRFQYMAKQPLGGGRVYSKTFLDSINWQLFDTTANKLLDDWGWQHVIAHAINTPPGGRVCNVINDPLILAVKGPWKCMNPLSKTLNHPNAKLLKMWKGEEAVRIVKEEFDYEY